MQRMISGVLFAIVMLMIDAPMSQAEPTRDPIGERANYQLDRNSQRTSSIVRSGSFVTRVADYLPDAEEGPAYNVVLDYDFNISLIGRRQGSQVVEVPAEYFTPEFLEKLRTDKDYEAPKFKIRHEGMANVRNMDGRSYDNCDTILIYDIKDVRATPLATMLASLAGYAEPMPAASIENLQIRAHIKYGIPVLGAVKIDISGKYNGVSIKVGADYQVPAARGSNSAGDSETSEVDAIADAGFVGLDAEGHACQVRIIGQRLDVRHGGRTTSLGFVPEFDMRDIYAPKSERSSMVVHGEVHASGPSPSLSTPRNQDPSPNQSLTRPVINDRWRFEYDGRVLVRVTVVRTERSDRTTRRMFSRTCSVSSAF